MSETPLTDTQNDYGYAWNWAEFARGLERDMNRYRLVTLRQEAEILKLGMELAAERAECLEQSRLNGMGGEREADLLGKIEVMRRALEGIAEHPHRLDSASIARIALDKTGNPL